MDRITQGLSARLETVVERNRFTIAVIFPVIGAFLLILSGTEVLPALLRFNPWLILAGVAVMRSPLIAGLLPITRSKAVWYIAVLTAYTYAVELVGVTTGWPYGVFSYTASVGPMAFGVPLALPLFFLPIVMNAYLLSIALFRSDRLHTAWRIAIVVGLTVAMDVVLDPAAVDLGFWSYASNGALYGVPLTNFAGWVISAAVTTVLLDKSYDADTLQERLSTTAFMLDDVVSFLLLWGAINVYYANFVPAALSVAALSGLAWNDRFVMPSFSAPQD